MESNKIKILPGKGELLEWFKDELTNAAKKRV